MLKKIIQLSAFKWLLAAAGVAACVVGPMTAFSLPDWWSSLTGARSSSKAAAVSAGTPMEGRAGSANAANHGGPVEPSPVPAAVRLADAFRFDVTIREVMQRWPRVSTSLADLQLLGYRVPLVTGTAQTDLAGALTYYFNSRQQVQRIAFFGTTGDGRELVRLVTSRYGFVRRVTNDPSLFLYEVPTLGGQSQSVLRLKLAPLLKADRPHQRFDVSLVIERPAEASVASRAHDNRK
jgi:hypothetical protein